MIPGMVLHLFYGVVAGGVLALVLPAAGFGDPGLLSTLGIGLAYGVVLFVPAAAFWMNAVLDIDPDGQDVAMFVLFHLIYGVTLGGFLGAGLV